MNKLQHPEIYRRMAEEHGQDMPPYRAYVTAALVTDQTFDLSKGPLSYPLGRQRAIVDIIDHLYLQPESRANLDRYRSLAWNTFAVAEGLKKEMDKIGFRTPREALRCLNLFLDFIITYGKTMNAKLENALWRAISWYLPVGAESP